MLVTSVTCENIKTCLPLQLDAPVRFSFDVQEPTSDTPSDKGVLNETISIQ